jgi:hypothetical protein
LESRQIGVASDQALTFAREHLGQVPAVIAARQFRVWRLWDPRNEVQRDLGETHSRGWQYFGCPLSVAIVVVGLYGIRGLLRNERRTAIPIIGSWRSSSRSLPAAMATLGSLQSRIRVWRAGSPLLPVPSCTRNRTGLRMHV